MVSSTIASADAQAIAEALAEYQLLMLDAPVSGGAVNGRRRHDGDGLRERCRPLPRPRAGAGRRGRQESYHIGSDIGLGSTVKIIHQLLAGVHIAVAAEAMALAARAGIHWRRCMTWSPTRRVIPGCLRIACSTSWMAITRQNPLSIFLSKISGW